MTTEKKVTTNGVKPEEIKVGTILMKNGDLFIVSKIKESRSHGPRHYVASANIMYNLISLTSGVPFFNKSCCTINQLRVKVIEEDFKLVNSIEFKVQ